MKKNALKHFLNYLGIPTIKFALSGKVLSIVTSTLFKFDIVKHVNWFAFSNAKIHF